MTELPPSLRDRILAQAKSEPVETRPKHVARSYGVVALGIALSLGMFFSMGGISVGDRSPKYLAAVFASGAVLLAVFGELALRRPSAAAPPTSRFVVSALGFPLGWAVATSALLFVWPLGGGEGHGPRHDAMCAALSVAMGIGPLVALVLVRRGTVFVASRWVGAALGAASLTWGSLLITLHCPCAEPMHLCLGHIVPAAIAGAVLGALGGRVLQFQLRGT